MIEQQFGTVVRKSHDEVGDYVILYARSGRDRMIIPCIIEGKMFDSLTLRSYSGEEISINRFSPHITRITEDEYNQAIMENI